MDYTTDACRSLFTQNQEDRMMTAMANGTYRKAFGTHGLCNSGPAAVFNSDKTSICAGDKVVFTDKSGGAPTKWSWTFTGGNPASSTQQNPTDTPDANNDILTASSGASYKWLFNGVEEPGATSQTFKSKGNGTYVVIVTDANGCSATSDPLVITGITTFANQASIDVFPNPGTGNFTLKLSITEKGNYEICLKNVLGQTLSTETLSNFKGDYNKQFDLTTYGKGVYMLSLIHANGQQVKKIIVE